MGESAETDLATYEHDADAVEEVAAELQDGIRAMVMGVLDPATCERLTWSTAGFPTLADMGPLFNDPMFQVLDTE